MMNTAPQDQHRWLRQFEGEWRGESEPVADGGADDACWRGSETVRALGDLWVLFEGRGDMPDGSAACTLMTLGFDPARYRDTIEVHGPNERTLSSHMEDAAGNWVPIMRIRYRRQQGA